MMKSSTTTEGYIAGESGGDDDENNNNNNEEEEEDTSSTTTTTSTISSSISSSIEDFNHLTFSNNNNNLMEQLSPRTMSFDTNNYTQELNNISINSNDHLNNEMNKIIEYIQTDNINELLPYIVNNNNKNKIIQQICKYNKVNIIEYIINNNLNHLINNESLFYSVSYNSLECTIYLCNYNKNYINELDKYGNCVLYLALLKKYINIADILILFGANIDISFKYGETMLHRAITDRRIDIVNYLIKHHANLLKLNSKNENPLFNIFVHHRNTIINNNNTNTINGNNTNTINGYNKHGVQLQQCSHFGFSSSGAIFLQQLIKSNLITNEIMIKALKQKNSHGRTMLHECIIKGDLPSFKIIIAYLSNLNNNYLQWFINDIETIKNQSCLHLSVIYNQFIICKMIIDALPGLCDLNCKDCNGKTALDYAIELNLNHFIQLFNNNNLLTMNNNNLLNIVNNNSNGSYKEEKKKKSKRSILKRLFKKSSSSSGSQKSLLQ
ncbi:hypothetical protein ABK040_015068 [Willaertia magna]